MRRWRAQCWAARARLQVALFRARLRRASGRLPARVARLAWPGRRGSAAAGRRGGARRGGGGGGAGP
eukprot:523799-Lingulodinium_polyedra.AAC.1